MPYNSAMVEERIYSYNKILKDFKKEFCLLQWYLLFRTQN